VLDRLEDKACQWLFVEATEALLLVDAAGRIGLANPAAHGLFGHAGGDLRGRSLAALLAAPDWVACQAELAGCAAGPGAERVVAAGVASALRRDGSGFAAEIRLRRLDRDLILVTVRDPAGRSRTDEVLRKFSRVIEQTASAVVITDSEGVIEYVNPRFTEVSGYSPAEVIGRRPSLLRSGHTTAAGYRELWRTIKAGGVWYGEFRNRRKDGALYWESAIISPVCDAQGRITHFVGIKDDISARKAVEQAAAEREAQYRAVIETAADGFWMLDTEGRILAVNDTYVRRSGYSREELLAMRVFELDAQESAAEVRDHIARLCGEGIDLFVTRHRTKDGEVWPVEVHATYSSSAGGRLFAFARDITERKRAEAELQALRTEMDRVTRFQVAGQTVAALAHELNQPLNAVMSYNEAALRLLRAGNRQPDRLAHALESSVEQAGRAGRVVRELLGFVRQGDGQTEPVDLNDLVRQILARADAGCALRFEPGPGLGPVSVNRLQLEKVLGNLIRNAMEAMADRAAADRRVSVSVGADAGMARVTVHDEGPGIEPETLCRIFDPFFTTRPGGLGMGLAISRAIVESHGGRLWAESAAGASFHFTLPFAS
jgi:two-component system sensor kinase FixL